jgi:phosphohistidine phosphatase
MELFLLRHARAEDSHLYSHDQQRPLSEIGRREQIHIAQVLAPLLRPLDYVLSSPLIRARQTADITAAALQFSQIIVETSALGENCTVGGVMALLEQYPPQSRLLCVGHEPFMSRLSAVFLDGAGHSMTDFQRSAIIGLHFPGHPAPGMGTLHLFLRPADMLALAP